MTYTVYEAMPLAAMLQPVILFCEKKLKMKRSLASVILVILTIPKLLKMKQRFSTSNGVYTTLNHSQIHSVVSSIHFFPF